MSTTDTVLRFSRPEPTYKDADLLKPLDTSNIMTEAEDCFGKEWDPTAKACGTCADNEICGIKFSAAVREKVKEMDKINQYLDLSDWTLVDDEDLNLWLGMRTRTSEQLLDKVLTSAKSTDEVAGIEYLKRFLKKNNWKVEGGKVYAK
jgi:hypothetical protein